MLVWRHRVQFGDQAIAAEPQLEAHAARVARAFTARFGASPRLFQAPGRINIIGEHTDYNGGLVMPAAIDRRCLVAIAPSNRRRLNVVSANLDAVAELDLDHLQPARNWTDYIAGVAESLRHAGVSVDGCNIWIDSQVPLGGGVSSSAALEVALAFAFAALGGQALDGTALAGLAQKAENEFVGMPCGIMDQFASANGVPDHALMLDCRTLAAEAVPLPPACTFLVVNSMVHHAHASGAYRQRREECERAARALGVAQLRDVRESDLKLALHDLDEAPARRARHVVTEIARVREAAEALRAGDLATLGRAMNASHASLRDDMAVSIPQLDTLAAIAQSTPGVIGARLMGGGFGGCVLALVERAAAQSGRAEIVARYAAQSGKTPDAFICRAVGGAGEVTL